MLGIAREHVQSRGALRYIILNLISVRAAVDIDLFHARIGEKLEGVLDQRSIGEWEQALAGYQ